MSENNCSGTLRGLACPRSNAVRLGAAPEAAVAHEFTHFLEFEMAGTARSRLPWWLSEGLAVYVANDYAPSSSSAALSLST